MARPISLIEVTPEEGAELRRRARATTSTQRDSLRARIVLSRAEGHKEEDVAAEVGVSLNTVSLWSKRFEAQGLEGLIDKAGRGRKTSLPLDKVRQAITRVTQSPPGRERWSTRSMASALGISHQSVQSIWSKNDLKPISRVPSRSLMTLNSTTSSGTSSACICTRQIRHLFFVATRRASVRRSKEPNLVCPSALDISEQKRTTTAATEP